MSAVARLRAFLRTRNGKVAAGATGAGVVVAAGLYSRSRGGGDASFTPDATGPVFSAATPGTGAYDGTLAGSGGYPGDGSGLDMLSVFADQIGAGLSNLQGSIDASAAANAETLAQITAAMAKSTASTAAATANQAVTNAVTGLGTGAPLVAANDNDVNRFLAAMAAEVNRRRGAGESDSSIESWLRQVAAAGGADPNKVGRLIPNTGLPANAIPGGRGIVSAVAAPRAPYRVLSVRSATRPEGPTAAVLARSSTQPMTASTPVPAPRLPTTLAIRSTDAASHRW